MIRPLSLPIRVNALLRRPAGHLSFPKIIPGRNGDVARTRTGWLQYFMTAAQPDPGAHPCPATSACEPHCNTPHKKKEFAAGAPRQRPASGPGTRGVSLTSYGRKSCSPCSQAARDRSVLLVRLAANRLEPSFVRHPAAGFSLGCVRDLGG